MVSGISSGASSKLIGLFLDSKDVSDEITSEADELIKQIGENADDPEEIPAVLDGFNFTFETAKGTINKRYTSAESE